ncbi:MAG: hypothetical protein JWQ90_4747 [Hydrocarboniphaga sp.]|uniref:DUF7064 domain-containing protein n=1 Tax=Hydrocarboniphaga sp. TaxID=2033016 RepID=UPI0026078967|nr:hypothetical protein [Hydrocarboniphaga sp.]MDB5972297.1 hypothetical protein [Hydrocarboniphaga sp.]
MSYDVSWDKPHRPGEQELWQESDCYWFYDASQGIGGFHRVGQQPNRGKGQLTLFAFKEGGERFVMSSGDGVEVDLTPDARQDSKQLVGGHSVEALGDGRMRFIWDEKDCAADLEFYESFHEPRNWSKTGHSDKFMSNINSDGHLECAGKLRGPIRIGSQTYRIDALAHRDRSWGFRDNRRAAMHRYRMFSGTVGPELSFASFLLDLKDGPKMVAGFVARNGVDHDVRDLRVLTTFDYDGFTPVGSLGILTLDNGEQLRIETKSVQGFMTPVPNTTNASQDHISTFTYEGKTGFLDLELCTNPGRGSYIPVQADVSFTTIDQGLSKSVVYEF